MQKLDLNKLITPSPTSVWARLSSRYVSLAGARIASALCRWFVLLQSAHRLTPTQFGVVAACLSATELLTGFGDLGTDSFVYARPMRIDRGLPRLIQAAICARLLASTFILFLALVLVILLLGQPELAPILLLIPANALQNTVTALLQKQNRFDLLARSAIIAMVASAMVASAAAILEFSILTAQLLLISPAALTSAASCLLARKLIRQTLHRASHVLARSRAALISTLGPTAIVGTLVILYSRLDVLIVAPLCGFVVQAQYSAAFRLIEPFFTLQAILSTAVLAELGSRSSGSAHRLGGRLLGLLKLRTLPLLALVLLMLGAVCYVFTLSMLQLGEATAAVAFVLGAAIPLRVINSALSVVMQRLSGFEKVMRAAIVNAAVTFPLAAILAWRYGAIGAALGALTGELINLWVQRHSLSVIIVNR